MKITTTLPHPVEEAKKRRAIVALFPNAFRVIILLVFLIGAPKRSAQLQLVNMPAVRYTLVGNEVIAETGFLSEDGLSVWVKFVWPLIVFSAGEIKAVSGKVLVNEANFETFKKAPIFDNWFREPGTFRVSGVFFVALCPAKDCPELRPLPKQPKILSSSFQNGVFSIVASISEERTFRGYSLEYKDSLAFNEPWKLYESSLIFGSPTIRFTDDEVGSHKQRFYRIRVH